MSGRPQVSGTQESIAKVKALFGILPILQELQQDVRALTREIQRLRTELRESENGSHKATAKPASPSGKRPTPRRRPIDVRAMEAQSVNVTRTSQKAAAYLHRRGFVIERYHEQNEESSEERSLSKFLGDRHNTTLAPLYGRLRELEVNQSFTMELADSTPEEISDSVQLCQKLSDVHYLHDHRYRRGAQLLQGTLTKDGEEYIRGRWLEQYIRRQLVSGFGRAHLGYSLLMNPQLAFVDGQKYELDLFVLERDTPIWLECTTAKNPRERLSRMGSLMSKLDIPVDRTLLIIAGMSDQRIRSLARGVKFPIVNATDFPDRLSQSLG